MDGLDVDKNYKGHTCCYKLSCKAKIVRESIVIVPIFAKRNLNPVSQISLSRAEKGPCPLLKQKLDDRIPGA